MKTRRLAPWRAPLPAVALAAFSLLLAACVYDAPLETQHTIKIDPAVLGVWQSLDPEGDAPETMVILPFSETEYLVHYPNSVEDGLYFRAYPIEVAGVPCVQIQLLGSPKGRETGTQRYQVATYGVVDDALEIRTLNGRLVSSEHSGGAALREAFKQHAADPELFTDPGKFRRVAR